MDFRELQIRCEEIPTTPYAGPPSRRSWRLIDKDGEPCGHTSNKDLVRALRGLPKDAVL